MISKNYNCAYGGSKDQKSTLFSTVRDLVNDEWFSVIVVVAEKNVSKVEMLYFFLAS